jgi:hypothetical protein
MYIASFVLLKVLEMLSCCLPQSGKILNSHFLLKYIYQYTSKSHSLKVNDKVNAKVLTTQDRTSTQIFFKVHGGVDAILLMIKSRHT